MIALPFFPRGTETGRGLVKLVRSSSTIISQNLNDGEGLERSLEFDNTQ